jgi:hypothetical protein
MLIHLAFNSGLRIFLSELKWAKPNKNPTFSKWLHMKLSTKSNSLKFTPFVAKLTNLEMS